MTIRLKFLHKLLILTVTPVLIAQIGTMLAVLQTTEQELEASAQQALRVGSAVAEQMVRTRNEQISRNLNLLASDYALKQVIAIADTASTRSALTNHANRIGADVATFVYTEDWDENAEPTSGLVKHIHDTAMAIWDEEDVVPSSMVVVHEKAVYQIFTAEVRAPTPIGYLMLGFKVGDSVVAPISTLTNLDVAILLTDDSGTHTTANAFYRDNSVIDPASLLQRQHDSRAVYSSMLASEEFWVSYLPLSDSSDNVHIVLASHKLNPLQHFLAAKDNVVAFGVGLLILVVALGAWLSTSVSRPLRSLALATRSLAQGQYGTAISATSTDEIGELASGFEDMRIAVANREEQISHQLMHDYLTGLPNKKHALIFLDKALSDAATRSVQVVVIKIQSMDDISSSLGLNATDELTRETAKTIASVAAPDQLATCIDNNRFAVLCPNSTAETAVGIAKAITTQLDLGTTLGLSTIILKSHVGIASYPEHSASAETLIQYAMIASVDADAKKRRINTYNTGREEEFKRYIKIVQDLPTAVEQEDLRVYFQPKIDIESGEVYGAEALVRWVHVDLGFLPPDDFISAAEQSGNIKLLTRFVLRKSIHAARQWQDMGYVLKVAVNLSARDLLDPDLYAYVTSLLHESGLAATQLILEITESSIMEDLDLAIQTLSTFRAAGIQISIDDFGTGHSSLAQLRDLPLDELKIDRSFVSQISEDNTNELLISTTIELAHNMGLKVVAEGIEDEYSLRRLNHHNCEIAQGYFFSRPLPEDDFVAWLKAYEPVDCTERRRADRPFSGPQGKQADATRTTAPESDPGTPPRPASGSQ